MNNLLNFHFKKYGVDKEGLNLLAAAATTFNKAFSNRMDYYWSYVVNALSRPKEV
jgi:hypothetical protein